MYSFFNYNSRAPRDRAGLFLKPFLKELLLPFDHPLLPVGRICLLSQELLLPFDHPFLPEGGIFFLSLDLLQPFDLSLHPESDFLLLYVEIF